MIVDSDRDRTDLKQWFDDIWEDDKLVVDVKEGVLRYLEQLYVDHSPEFIYFKTLYHVFERFLSGQEEDAKLFERLEIVDTEIWKALFDFQKDGVKGAIHKINSAKNEHIQIRSSLTIEHVMPVAWETHWPLPDGRIAKTDLERIIADDPDEEADKRDHVIHTIGNLTLLTQPLNSAIQNSAWSDKKPEITGQSALALNREFLERETWDENAIEERGRELLTHALALWPR